MLKLLVPLILATTAQVEAQRVAVIDTGYNGPATDVCAKGSFDFIAKHAQVGFDSRGHGTAVVHAIQDRAKDKSLCVLVYKVFDGSDTTIPRIAEAINFAVDIGHATVINLSLEGAEPVEREKEAIARALSLGVKVFVAAGNANRNLDTKCDVYPACYALPGMEVVSGNTNKTLAKAGNTGKIVTQSEDYCFEHLCGTSLSTALATGNYIHNIGVKP